MNVCISDRYLDLICSPGGDLADILVSQRVKYTNEALVTDAIITGVILFGHLDLYFNSAHSFLANHSKDFQTRCLCQNGCQLFTRFLCVPATLVELQFLNVVETG